LLDVAVIVVGVLVERELADRDQGVVLVWPDAGIIEDVPSVGLGVLWVHDLQVHSPGWVVALFNGVVHILDVVVWLFAREADGVGSIHGDIAGIGLEMYLDVLEAPIVGLAELERVNTVHVDVAKRLWNTSLAEKLHQGMHALENQV
jgi:hypothetical protein